MLIDTLKLLFERDLKRLKSEIKSYKDEKNLWRTEMDITNSAGNLCIHLIGNLNSFIGAQLGRTNYIRHREFEFSTKDISRPELIKKIDETIAVIDKTLDKLTDDQMKDEYPILIFEQKTSTEYFLVNLTTHLAYHLGQINYHRRLFEG